MLCGLFVGIVGYLGKAELNTFNKTKIAVDVIKIEQFDRVPNGRSGSAYQAFVEFNYLNQTYRIRTVITQWEYQHQEQIQQYPKTLIKIYFSPVIEKGYSESSLEQNGSNAHFYFALFYAIVSFIIGFVIIYKAGS